MLKTSYRGMHSPPLERNFYNDISILTIYVILKHKYKGIFTNLNNNNSMLCSKICSIYMFPSSSHLRNHFSHWLDELDALIFNLMISSLSSQYASVIMIKLGSWNRSVLFLQSHQINAWINLGYPLITGSYIPLPALETYIA